MTHEIDGLEFEYDGTTYYAYGTTQYLGGDDYLVEILAIEDAEGVERNENYLLYGAAERAAIEHHRLTRDERDPDVESI